MLSGRFENPLTGLLNSQWTLEIGRPISFKIDRKKFVVEWLI
jgi:hypothetical protein